MKQWLPIAILAPALALGPVVAYAQDSDFPNRPVTLIVPYSPGGGSDNIARATAQFLSNHWKQSVVVENKPGADGLIATRMVMREKPDGYTLLISIPAIAALKYINKELKDDPLVKLRPVSMLATGPTGIVAKGDTDIKTITDLKKTCSQPNAQCSWASGEPFTLLAGSGLVDKMGLNGKMTNIRYAGTSAAINDIIGGRVTMVVTGTSSVLPHHKAGTMKILAVSSAQRLPQIPDVPTYAEEGLGDVEFTNNWYGIFAPADTPDAVVKRIADAMKLAAQDPGVLKVLQPLLITPVGNTPEEFTSIVARDQKTVDKLSDRLQAQ
ncbi:Bug family tripartite tricarboxylate transporter substrate binding protein [Bordetella tumulicola]|uniref:Bug family tripartite tricarboxylate transporter substrate binding protein n=1 Tax=Bordetella tumulicola TaxID=1649133 RepID=UPI0039EDF09E